LNSQEEEMGLDLAMHGEEAYPDTFGHGLTLRPAPGLSTSLPAAAGTPVIPVDTAPIASAQPEISVIPSSGIKMTTVVLIIKQEKFEALKSAMSAIGITGMTVTQVLGFGMQKGAPEYYRGVRVDATLLPKVKVEIVVSKVPVRTVIETAKKVLHTGHIGDGKIFVYDVENVVKVRTGEEGYDALQDEE
jgi:Amt family ammonium transporter